MTRQDLEQYERFWRANRSIADRLDEPEGSDYRANRRFMRAVERAIARVEDPLEREVLRLRYHEESCSGLNYRRASEETTDECLSEILLELSHDEYRHARQLLCLLEKQMPI